MMAVSEKAKMMLDLRQGGVIDVGVLEAIEMTPRDMLYPHEDAAGDVGHRRKGKCHENCYCRWRNSNQLFDS